MLRVKLINQRFPRIKFNNLVTDTQATKHDYFIALLPVKRSGMAIVKYCGQTRGFISAKTVRFFEIRL